MSDFFDNLVKKASKAVNGVAADIAKSGIVDDFKKAIDDVAHSNVVGEVSDAVNEVFGTKPRAPENKYTIPEIYNIFPKYEGEIITKPVENNTEESKSITIVYSGKLKPEYISLLAEKGYIKLEEEKYGKDNTYITVKSLGNTTEVVFCINN